MSNNFRSTFACCILATIGLFAVGCGGSAEPDSAQTGGDTEVQNQIANEVNGAIDGGEMEDGGGGHGAEPGGGNEDEYAMEMEMQMSGAGGNGGGENSGGGHGAEPGAMNSEDEMMYGDEMYAGGPGGNQNGGYPGGNQGQNANQLPSRPADVSTWTTEHLLTAVEEKDARVLQAIETQQTTAAGDPAFAATMTQVLQASAGGQSEMMGAPGADGPGGGFGLPGMGTMFQNGPDPAGALNAVPQMPANLPKVPPGGAFYRPRSNLRSGRNATALDSLDVMLGEAILTYSPQATQAVRGAADRLQENVSGHEAAAPANMSSPSGQGNAATSGGAGHGAAPPAGMNSSEMMESTEMMESEMYGSEYNNSGYESGPGGNQAVGTLDQEDLVRTIVRALVFNNTPQAWNTLQGIVAGSTPTALPPPKNTEIVIAEVFSAEELNVPVAQEMLSTAANAVAADPVQNQPTMRLLAALGQGPADHFMQLRHAAGPPPGSPPPGGPGGPNGQGMNGQSGGRPPGAPGMAAGMQEYPGSDAAMMEMSQENYEGGNEGAYMGADAGNGFGAPGGRPGPPPPGMHLPPVRVSEAAMIPVASVLWNKQSVDTVSAQLMTADSPDAVMETLAFASTIPSNSVRHATYTLFSKVHEQGANGLTGSGLFRDVARDPGMLTVLKALPRTRPKAPPAGAPPSAASGDSWSMATQDLVLSLRDRLREAANNPDLQFNGKLPVRLHRDGAGGRDVLPERSIHIRVPGDAASALGDAAPAVTRMYYASCKAMPTKASEMQVIVDHYEKRTKGIKREDRLKGILWYDGVKKNADGTRETMDVIIEQVGANRPGNQSGGAGQEYGGGQQANQGPVQFSIEVIVVVTRDPQLAPDSTGVTTAAK